MALVCACSMPAGNRRDTGPLHRPGAPVGGEVSGIITLLKSWIRSEFLGTHLLRMCTSRPVAGGHLSWFTLAYLNSYCRDRLQLSGRMRQHGEWSIERQECCQSSLKGCCCPNSSRQQEGVLT